MPEIADRVKLLSGSEFFQRPLTIPEGTIRLELGKPDFPTLVHIQDVATKPCGTVLPIYESAYGEPALREAICFSLKRDFVVERKPENVLITTGYSGGIADGGK